MGRRGRGEVVQLLLSILLGGGLGEELCLGEGHNIDVLRE